AEDVPRPDGGDGAVQLQLGDGRGQSWRGGLQSFFLRLGGGWVAGEGVDVRAVVQQPSYGPSVGCDQGAPSGVRQPLGPACLLVEGGVRAVVVTLDRVDLGESADGLDHSRAGSW